MNKLAIFGAHQNGEVLHFLLDKYFKEEYEVVGFVHDPSLPTLKKLEEKILCNLDNTKPLQEIGCQDVVLSTGKLDARLKALEELNKRGFNLPSLVFPYSEIPDSVIIGEGVVIYPFNFFYPESNVGDGCFVATHNFFGYGATLKTNVYVSTFCHIGHRSEIGENTKLRSRVIIGDEIKIGKNCYISPASFVKKDLPDDSSVKGFVKE